MRELTDLEEQELEERIKTKERLQNLEKCLSKIQDLINSNKVDEDLIEEIKFEINLVGV